MNKPLTVQQKQQYRIARLEKQAKRMKAEIKNLRAILLRTGRNPRSLL